MSFTITIQCPKHPTYQAKTRAYNGCRGCQLMFDVRNNANRMLSVPREERTDLNEILVKSVE
jgi:hypothetical protein